MDWLAPSYGYNIDVHTSQMGAEDLSIHLYIPILTKVILYYVAFVSQCFHTLIPFDFFYLDILSG